MGKHSYKQKISPSSIYLNFYSIYKINKDSSIIYRCKFCFNSRIKKSGKYFFRISAHKHHCNIYKNRLNSKMTFIKKFSDNKIIQNLRLIKKDDKNEYRNERTK